jgi:hypothetical protein
MSHWCLAMFLFLIKSPPKTFVCFLSSGIVWEAFSLIHFNKVHSDSNWGGKRQLEVF